MNKEELKKIQKILFKDYVENNNIVNYLDKESQESKKNRDFIFNENASIDIAYNLDNGLREKQEKNDKHFHMLDLNESIKITDSYDNKNIKDNDFVFKGPINLQKIHHLGKKHKNPDKDNLIMKKKEVDELQNFRKEEIQNYQIIQNIIDI